MSTTHDALVDSGASFNALSKALAKYLKNKRRGKTSVRDYTGNLRVMKNWSGSVNICVCDDEFKRGGLHGSLGVRGRFASGESSPAAHYLQSVLTQVHSAVQTCCSHRSRRQSSFRRLCLPCVLSSKTQMFTDPLQFFITRRLPV